MTVYQRKRKLLGYLVLVQLLYGRHGSVCWTSPTSCVITSRMFSESIGTNTTQLRIYVEWLRSQRLVRDVTIGHGFITLTIVPPVDRSTHFSETTAA